MATQSIHRLTEEEYLTQDRANPFRSEYIDGEMLAMAGGSLRHAAIAARCIAEMNQKLAGRGCTVFTSDARVRTPATGSYVYPDVTVVCGEVLTQGNMADVLVNPTLVCEVLSPSTRDYDQGHKFELYREIPSLKEYLLIHTDSVTIAHFSRQADSSWLFREVFGPGGSLSLPALGINVDVDHIYGEAMSIPG